MKSLRWLGSSREEVRRFAEEARRNAGYELYLVQNGLEPSDSKPMPSIGLGVREIRIHTNLEHRIIYVTRLGKQIFVLHAFEKRSRKTARRDIDLARERFALALRLCRTDDI